MLKSDPFAFYSEVRPANASVTADIRYDWNDAKWIEKRTATPLYDKPVNIYEMHFASWKTHEDGTYLTYKEMADELIPYVKKMGYTHIEVMPLAEYPFDGSWGYQVTGLSLIHISSSPRLHKYSFCVLACHLPLSSIGRIVSRICA